MRKLVRRPVFIAVVSAALIGIALDLFDADVSQWFGDHQFVTAIVAEVLLLAGVYFGLQFLLDETDKARWRAAAREPLRLVLGSAQMMDGRLRAALDANASDASRTTSLQEAGVRAQVFAEDVDRYQALLTASPYMAGFLPVSVELAHYARTLVDASGRRGKIELSDDWRKTARENYEAALHKFMVKYAEAVDHAEFGQRWDEVIADVK